MPTINLFNNILENFNFLRTDFTTFSISINGIFSFVAKWLFIVLLFATLFSLGNRLRKKFFKNYFSPYFNLFFDIALGYIFFGTGIAILGTLNLLYAPILLLYSILIILASLYKNHELFWEIRSAVSSQLLIGRDLFKKDKWIYIIVLGFILIGFLRTIPPEIGVDAIGYHTTYPRIYNFIHTLMVKPTYLLHVTTIPQLTEIYYVFADSFRLLDASRSIHFVFYAFLILLFITYTYVNKKSTNLYAPLLFVSAPLIIRQNSSAYGDFAWVLCWFLSVIIVCAKSRLTYRSIVFSAFLFGGVLATKLWSIIFLTIFVVYFFVTYKKKIALRYSVFFLIISLIIPSIWYIRSFILTGSPIYPAFSHDELFYPQLPSLKSYFLNDLFKAKISSLINFSPILFLGIISFVYFRKKYFKIMLKEKIHLFIVITLIAHFIFPYSFGHYLFGWYILICVFLSFYLLKITNSFKTVRIIIAFISIILFSYYIVNTFLILPYGFGWADKNKYLSRILSKDNSSYYDYDYKFSKHLKKTDVVATYRLLGFYYADFIFISAIDSFRNDEYALYALKKNGVSKLLIKGGDMEWFCNEMKVKDCQVNKYKLLAAHETASQYLYELF